MLVEDASERSRELAFAVHFVESMLERMQQTYLRACDEFAGDAANDVDIFFEYTDDMRFSTAQVDAFTTFQDEMERWRLLATQTLAKPVKPCCTYYGQPDVDIWQAIKVTPPIASLGKAFIVPTPEVAKR